MKRACEGIAEHIRDCRRRMGILPKDQMYQMPFGEPFHDSEDKLTEKGTIACNVHEMNNLVFSDLYQHTNGFDSHSPVDIACLLSLFYDIKVSDDVKSFSTNILVDDVRFVNDQLNKYQNIDKISAKQYK